MHEDNINPKIAESNKKKKKRVICPANLVSEVGLTGF